MPHSTPVQPITPLAATVNGCAVALLANLSMTILHELGHLVPALLFDLAPELHHDFVYFDQSHVPANQLMLVAAAGPVSSLVLGGVFLGLEKQIRRKGIGTLLLLWLGLYGLLFFFGYLFIAPFFRNGDTGIVFALLGLPNWLIIMLSVTGVAVMTWLFVQLTTRFAAYGDAQLTIGERAKQLILWPVMVCMAGSLLHLPVTNSISLFSPLMMPLAFMAMYRPFKRITAEAPTVPLTPVWWAIGLALLAVITLFRWLIYPIGA